MEKKFLSGCLVFLIGMNALSLKAENEKPQRPDEPIHVNRCFTKDSLDKKDALARMAWAKRCKLLTQRQIEFFIEEEHFPSYSHTNGDFRAPIDINAPCDGWLKAYISCPWGCYTADQRLMFDGRYLRIDEASKNLEKTITALSIDSMLEDLRFQEQNIESYVTGDTEELVYKFTVSNNHTLEVTSIHPMVTADGSIIQAKNIKVGDNLLSAEGIAEKVLQIDTRTYKGTVYNITPKSEQKLENIFVAEGLLTGSNRFQNEWIDTDFRLRNRKSLDISDL